VKYFCTIIIVLFVIFSLSCESAGAGDSALDTNKYPKITKKFTPENYSGFLDKKSDDIAGSVDSRQQDAQSVYSYGAAVCEGYTSLFMALLRGRGIPVQYISGTANGGNHAWNNVFNGTEWKLIDPTWDDPLIDTGSGATSNYPDGFNLRYNYYWMDNLADHSPIDYYTTRSAVPANPIY